MEQYVFVEGEVAVKTTNERGQNSYEMLPANEVNWTRSARKFSERRDYRRQYLAERVNNTLTVTIGKGDLTDAKWSSLNYALWNLGLRMFTHFEREEAYGRGRWKGVMENNYVLVIRSEKTLDPAKVEELKAEVEHILRSYKQEAAGFTLGTSELIHG